MVLSAGLVAQGNAPVLLFSSDFNAASGDYASKGSLPAVLRPMGPNQRHGKPGSGVSGLTGDRAWDASANTSQGAGVPVNTSRVQVDVSGFNLSDLKGFTLAFWFKTEQATDDGLRLFCLSISPTGGISHTQRGMVLRTFRGGLEMFFGTGASSVRATSEAHRYNQTDTWTFAAITWDGSDVMFYAGDRDSGVKKAGHGRFSGPLTHVPGSPILGNHIQANRGLDGWLDNVRFYDGPLSLQALEALRAADAAGSPL
ncbi:hypothetical protein OPIT5_29175 [Opitutaceae bacterium TAV5]|nr:hypothetical protein OPIT5_29175 [Opitutaceae bacterium TAV5]